MAPSLLILDQHRRPNQPNQHSRRLESRGRPQRPRDAKPTIRKLPPDERPQQQKQRRAGPPVPLRIPQRKQLDVREQITVVARQHHARQRVVLEHPARNSLAAALEGQQGDGHEHVPADVLRVPVAGGAGDGDHGGGGGGQEQLGGEGGAHDPAAGGREEAVEAGEDEGTEAEGEEGHARLDPAG